MGSRFSPDFRRAVKKTMNLEVLQYNPKENHEELQLSLALLAKAVDVRKQELAAELDW